MTTVYVVAIPWDSYRASGALAFDNFDDAQAYCDLANKDDNSNTTLFVSKCIVFKSSPVSKDGI